MLDRDTILSCMHYGWLEHSENGRAPAVFSQRLTEVMTTGALLYMPTKVCQTSHNRLPGKLEGFDKKTFSFISRIADNIFLVYNSKTMTAKLVELTDWAIREYTTPITLKRNDGCAVLGRMCRSFTQIKHNHFVEERIKIGCDKHALADVQTLLERNKEVLDILGIDYLLVDKEAFNDN